MTQDLRALTEVGNKRTGQHAGGRQQRYLLSDADRNLIRAVYGNPEYGTTSESIDYLLGRLPVSRATIKIWGGRLGLARTRDDYWTEEEIAYLNENYQRPAGKRASIKSIAKYLGRTEAAVRLKAKRMKFRRHTSDAYTVHSLADALGCDWHKVGRWIERGILIASREGSREDKRYSITPAEVRRFIIANPSEIDHRRADWMWLLDILVGDTENIGGIEGRGRKRRKETTR